jgi:hypothetical protein
MHLGRERPHPNRARDRVRGVAEGVAHAPDVSFTASDSRADCDTGGTKRRPLHRSEIAQSQGHQPIDLAVKDVHATARLTESCAPRRGNIAPESAFPPLFFRQSSVGTLQPGSETTSAQGGRVCGYERPCEPLRGSILTRVPPSSIDRSAPRSISSRCASSALAMTLTAPSESRS